MKYRTLELEGVLLDVAVAIAEGLEWHYEWVIEDKKPTGENVVCVRAPSGRHRSYAPSTDGGDGAPIIEQQRIGQMPMDGGGWYAEAGMKYLNGCPDGYEAAAEGPTCLIASMRAYVAAKLGHEIDIPSPSDTWDAMEDFIR